MEPHTKPTYQELENELKKAKVLAKKREDELDKIQEIVQLGSWSLDLATNEVKWTKQLFEMYGFDPQKPIPPYTEHQKLFTPKSWETLSEELAKTAETGIPYELELNTVREDGSNGWMWVRGEAERDSNNKIIGLWGAAQDISMQKEISEAKLSVSNKKVADSEKRLAYIFDNIKEPIWLIDFEKVGLEFAMKLELINNAYTEFTGVNLENHNDDVLLEDVFPKEILESILPRYLHVIKNEEVYKYQETLELPGGKGVFETTLVPIFNEKNDMVKFLGIAYDKTQISKIEEELVSSQRQYKNLLENVHMAILTANKKGEITSANAECSSVFGYSSDEFLDININDLVGLGMTEGGHNKLMKSYFNNPSDRKMDSSERTVLGKHKNGSSIPLEISLSYYISESGPEAIAIVKDISEKEEAKETKKQLIERETLLKEIHHRVKNNLQVITSLLALQSSSIEDARVKELFRSSQHRINAMSGIHEMLYQSDSLSEINYSDYLNSLLSSLLLSMVGVASSIKINIKCENINFNIDTAIPLGLLINEIVTNSIKHGVVKDSNGIISVTIVKVDETNYTMLIGDNGVGIKNVIQRERKSLGLKLIKQLTKQIKGTIEKDESKKGTNYIINFKQINQVS